MFARKYCDETTNEVQGLGDGRRSRSTTIVEPMATHHGFDARDRVTVLAHRGLATNAPELSLAAFRAALDAGADILECDVRATADGIAVFAHDETFARIHGDPVRVCDLTYAEIRDRFSDGDRGVVSVQDALRAFPVALFNIDVKERDVIEPLARAVRENRAESRVLITSFSGSRRRRALRVIPGASTSGSADTVAGVVVACALGMPRVARWWSRGVRILQIPTRVLGIDTSSSRMLQLLHRAGFVVHFWTINDADEMHTLRERGADGIVTDRCDVAISTFRAN